MTVPHRFTVCLLSAFTLTIALGTGVPRAGAAPRIVLEEFSIEPTELKLGESFTIRAKAVATGVPLGSFQLRTADEVPKQQTVPGFTLYANGKWYLAEKGKYYLMDNGTVDEDSREGRFAVTLSTKDWKEGVTPLAFFASRRPTEGPFVAARHDLAVTVRGDRVFVEDLGGSSASASRAIQSFQVEPLKIAPGESVRLSARINSRSHQGIRIANPYYIAPADALPGFVYDPEQKKSFLGVDPAALLLDNGPRDLDKAQESVSVELATGGWRPGAHHLQFDLVGPSGRPVDYRSFAVKVLGPDDRLNVSVEDAYLFDEGTHFGRFLKLRDGTLFSEDKVSTDQGLTWQSGTGGFGVGGEELADGTVLGFDYRCLPTEKDDGWYLCERSTLNDGGRTFRKDQARFFVPEAKPAMGHGPHKGPLFMRSIIERKDGSLVALMAGWFKSDTALCPYGRGRPYSRTYVCQSADRGATWEYLTTIGYDQIGSEGYNEAAMRRLPNGEWLAVLRTGSETDVNCQDNPIMWSVSNDEGRTWSKPERTGVEGAYPSLAILSDGTVAMSYGRPGAMLVFSHDRGRTWTDHTLVDATPYSGYTDVVELSPGLLLVGFGTRDLLDPASGERSNQLRLAQVRYSYLPTEGKSSNTGRHSVR